MTEDQVRDLIILLLFLVPIAIGLYVGSALSLKQHRQKAMDVINQYLSGIGKSLEEVKIYSTGHPYTWCEITLEDLNKNIKDNSWFIFSPIPVPKKVDFLLNFNSSKNALHIVFTSKKSFDWESLQYYEEFIKKS